MYELVISTRNGSRHSVGVRDWREANTELARFKRQYSKNHPHDEIIDVSVLNRLGDRVAQSYGDQLEYFN